MQVKTHKLKACLALRVAFIVLCALCFAMPAQAQETVKMKNGSMTVPSTGYYQFYDSGGEHQMMPIDDPSNNYNWANMYQSPELHELTFEPNSTTEQVGVKVTFDYLLINNDWLYVYEGESSSTGTLIAAFTGDNDYTDGVAGDGVHYSSDGEKLGPFENNNNKLTVQTTGPITFRFEADGSYRDHGWRAKVEGITSIAQPTPPVVLMQKCANTLQLFQTSVNSTMYYSIGYGEVPNDPDTRDPLSVTQSYTPGEIITIPADATYPVYVKAVSKVGNDVSIVSTYKFEDALQQPVAPTLTLVEGTSRVHVTTEVYTGNDTYYVRYTTSGEDPTTANPISQDPSGYTEIVQDPETKKVDAYIEITEPCTLQAVKRGTNCPENFSEIATLTITTVYVPAPEITIVDGGSTTIACSLSGATIKYTTDGSDPKTSSTAETYSEAFTVNPGTTVKAYAYVGTTGYEPSPVASEIYVPEGGSGVYNNSTVLLDDREVHSWSYYSDGDQPIHSLNPADVKITYYGYGANTMTGTSTVNMPDNSAFNTEVTADQVAVNVGEPGNQFIYLKTLENANEDGSGNYPYTMIYNPFQVRPAKEAGTVTTTTRYVRTTTITAGKKYLIVSASNAGSAYALGHSGTTVAADAVTISSGGTANYIDASYVDATSVWTANSGYTFQNGNYYIRHNNNTLGISTTNNNNSWTWNNNRLYYSSGSGWSSTTYYLRYNNEWTISEGGWSTYNVYLFEETTETTVTGGDYRGFYAWRVKSLGGGLTISGKDVDDIIYPDETIEFVTSNAEGNEVEFEALWAKAWVNESSTSNRATNSGNYKNAFERNFKTTIANYEYPVTFTTLMPDGSGTLGSGSTGSYSCNSDVKFENMTLNATSLNANSNNMHIGRGVSNGNSNVATSIYGKNSTGTTTNSFTLRIESGRYTNAYIFNGNATITSEFTVNAIFGSDYDRANNNTNTNLTISGPVEVALNTKCSSANSKISIKTLSGTFGANADNNEFYLGFENVGTTNSRTHRYLEVLGGNFLGGISGGIEYGVAASTTILEMRIKGGTVHRYLYGAGQYAAAVGIRKTIITGGTFDAWVAGGCYGTDANGNAGNTNGDTYIYFGGDANMTNTDGVFGGGYGRGDAGDNKYTINKSFVVVADEAQIAGNVYGGGNKGYNTDDAEVYVLGGGKNTLTVSGSVFGGANQARSEAKTTVTMENGTVSGSLYGGANASGTVAGLATVNMQGGTVTNVFGGGLGASTSMASGTVVNVTGGTINNNVYGGGQLGSVTQNTEVTVSGGTMQNVFGAGLGTEATAISNNANIGGNTVVTVSGGTVSKSVYGGGENGAVAYNSTGKSSLVTISGGTIGENVFGGGNNGFTNGPTTVNIDGGTIEGSVFGGAFGKKGKVYVAGLRTVNMRGGTVNKNVYGGSRNADDALTFSPGTFSSSNVTTTASVVNFSGGHVYYQLFASGYFGNVFGSTYAFIGTNAIMNAPHHIATTEGTYNAEYYGNHQALQIDGSVWAGGDFGNYDGTRFGDPTITGNSCIYVDGTDYETNGTTINNLYMNIGGSLFGCGTSCDAGKGTRHIIVREYGDIEENPNWNSGSKEAVVEPYTHATRSLYSIQRADYLDIDNAHINLLGQGKINSLVNTEHYTIHEFAHVRVSNGSSLFLNAPADQIVKFGSYSVDDVYKDAPTYTKIVHAGTTSTLEDTPNKIRVNVGSYIMIHHDGVAAGEHSRAEGYGELEGFAYMMTEGENETCAYARPRQGTDEGNTISNGFDNPNDGGWVSYNSQYNTFYDSGASGCGTTGSGVMQMPYENHTALSKNGEQYFRIWRYGDKYLYREGVFVAQSDGTSNFSTTDVTIPLPASLGEGSYFRIKSLSDGNTTIDYGDDVMTVNAAYTEPTVVGTTVINPEDGEHSNWMYFSTTSPYWMDGQAHDQSNIEQGKTFITNKADVNFGLVAIPQGSIAGQQTLLICENSDEQLALAKWYNTDETQNGSIVFRLTYNNALTNNVVWDPITIVFEHVDASGTVQEVITVKLTVTTLTNIEQPFSTEVYAIMRGNGDSKAGTYTAKVVLPQYVMNVNESGEISEWTCTNVAWTPNTEAGFDDDTWVTSTNNPYLTHDDKFALTFKPGLNYDQTTGWDEYYQGADLNSYGWNQTSFVLGRTTARDPIAFDFTMQFDEGMHVDDNVLMGKLVFTMHFTNYANAAPSYEKDLTITVYVYRIGIGNIYYLDGVHGNNLYSGTYPNAAKKSLSGIFNRTDYRYGDYIFIVNTVTADGSLEWNGKQYQEVTLYRYPGRHELADYADLIETSYWEDYDRANNACFEGALVQVGGTNAGNMTMNGIVLDGFHDLTEVGSRLYPQLEGQQFQTGLDEEENPIYEQLTWTGTYVNPSSPLVNIQSGSTLTMFGQSRMTGNYNKNDGGAVYNAGTFNIYDGSEISGNGVVDGKNGGGVYLASGATLQLSDLVTINDNHLFTAGETNDSDELGINNNVYLPDYTSTVTVGTATTTDVYTVLDNASRIGITSLPEENWVYQEAPKWYLPVAFSDGGLANYLQNIIDNGIIFDDKDEYDVVSLNNADWVNNPTDYLYFVGTWVTAVKKNPQDPDHPNNFNPLNIDTEDELAWLISYVNGLNHADPHPNTVATLAADLDMNAHIWVPIGSVRVPYIGDFDGNGHVVVGLRSPLNNTHMGMFGITNGADISNVIAEANFQGGTMKNVGTVIGTMNGGTLSNVEAAGTLVGTSMTHNMGGVVGQATKEGDVTKPVIHSAFAVNTMTGGANTVVGGLVGTNGADLYNSYANATMAENNQATQLGGLVGINQTGCTVENCYVINPIGPAFAYTNNGNINYCYAAKGTAATDYVTNGTQPTTHGTYDVVKERKEIGYMYDDNAVTKVGSDSNPYIATSLSYKNIGGTDSYIGVIDKWPGLLSTLNQWVEDPNHTGYTPWYRPTSADINGDLPVLRFPKDNCFATIDGKYLEYSATAYDEDFANDDNNGLDSLLKIYNNKAETSYLFLYNNATNVAYVPSDNVNVFINENAVLIQEYEEEGGSKDGEDENNANFRAVVGVTFENSEGTSGNTATPNCSLQVLGSEDPIDLLYDWHMMSSPLKDASMGIEYGANVTIGFGEPADISAMVGNYFPNGLTMETPAPDDQVKWDLYAFYEPQYHWINLKRSSGNHWHYDINGAAPCIHEPIDYPNEGVFEPAKGYMMAISQDSYLSNDGKLNNGKVEIPLTYDCPWPNAPEHGCNLIGNPFHAYLDMEKFLSKNEGFTKYYVYSAEWNAYIGSNADASENPALPSGTLAPFQGFFVKVSSTEQKAIFNNGMATTNPAAYSNFRGGRQNYPLVNLYVKDANGAKDLSVIEFNRPEMGGTEKLRVLKTTNFEIYARMDDQDYSILFTKEGTQRVPVWFKTNEDGVFTLTWNTYHGNFTSLRLVDNLTGVNYDMLSNDSYTFEASADDYASRFYITFSCTGVDEEMTEESGDAFAFFDGSEWIINGKGQLEVIDITGRVLQTEKLTSDQNRIYLNYAPGVYMIRVIDNKNVKTQKVIVR